MFDIAYKGKTVLVTGHTGFKGAWLTAWLLRLGANVVGISDGIKTSPSLFEILQLENKIDHHFADIRDFKSMHKIINSAKPDYIFHLAAQAIVSVSYDDPLDTITTNAVGTAVLLEVLRGYDHVCNVVMITSDKCYENVEWLWGYRESDQLGGKDIYSASKACAENIFHAYFHSWFKSSSETEVNIVTARAGNVIGGGDWAKDRLIVDCVKNWSEGKAVEIRSPTATRPWQHVLEPLSGYLRLASVLAENGSINGESFNFGPRAEQNRSVVEILSDLSDKWGFEGKDQGFVITDNVPFKESGLLKLNCDKALAMLGWNPNLGYDECIDFVGDWYSSYYKSDRSIEELTYRQIETYEKLGAQRELIWAK